MSCHVEDVIDLKAFACIIILCKLWNVKMCLKLVSKYICFISFTRRKSIFIQVTMSFLDDFDPGQDVLKIWRQVPVKHKTRLVSDVQQKYFSKKHSIYKIWPLPHQINVVHWLVTGLHPSLGNLKKIWRQVPVRHKTRLVSDVQQKYFSKKTINL